MGRAFEVRKKAMAVTNAAKTKLYAKFGKELILAAKSGTPDPEMNVALKRTIDKAKRAQVPTDVIKRAIEKAKSGVGENYASVTYEGFGPGASTVIVECLTDNVNRAISEVRNCFTKSKSKLGVTGAVAHNYDHVAVLTFKGLTEDAALEACMVAEVDIKDVMESNGSVTVVADPKDLYATKNAIEAAKKDVVFDTEEVTYIPQNGEYIDLVGEDLDFFNRLLEMLEEVDDVQDVYHNVNI
jgi:YebC/PmpR family DNA-binding regulatory protein